MSDLSQNQKYLHFFLKYKEKDYTIDVESSEEKVKLSDILRKVNEKIDSQISFKTHVFEVSLRLFLLSFNLKSILRLRMKFLDMM